MVIAGLTQVEYLIKKREASQKGGLSSRRSEIFTREVTPTTYREVLKEIKRRQIFNVIVDIKHLPLFFRIVSTFFLILLVICVLLGSLSTTFTLTYLTTFSTPTGYLSCIFISSLLYPVFQCRLLSICAKHFSPYY